jgi:hypothetical protein
MSTKQRRANLMDLHRKIFECPIGFNVHYQSEGNLGKLVLIALHFTLRPDQTAPGHLVVRLPSFGICSFTSNKIAIWPSPPQSFEA